MAGLFIMHINLCLMANAVTGGSHLRINTFSAERDIFGMNEYVHFSTLLYKAEMFEEKTNDGRRE